MSEGARSMVLAAGKGTRMGDITRYTPKPLVKVLGRSMLDRALDHIEQCGLGPTVVNVHHLAHRLTDHLTPRIEDGSVLISDERAALLETGGGVKKARHLFEGDRILIINGDVVWTDGAVPTLDRLWHAFEPGRMDLLMLAVPTGLARGYDGPGDLVLGAGERITALEAKLRGEEAAAPHMFGGIFVADSSLYDTAPEGAWSNRILFQEAEARGRLFALEHTGNWMHVGTEDGLAEATAVLEHFERHG